MAGKTKSATGKSIDTIKSEKEVTSKVSLKYLLMTDESLKKDAPRRMLYLSMAQYFEKDLKDNLDRTSFDLFEAYEGIVDSPAAWSEFIQYPVVKDYIDRFHNERAAQVANKKLANSEMKTSDALKVKAHVEANTKKVDNSNIVVMLLPQ